MRLFLSTPSVGRATLADRGVNLPETISIHALRGEGDIMRLLGRRFPSNFYPRPPWGGRPSGSTALERLV